MTADTPTIASPTALLDRADVAVDDREAVIEHEHHADLYDGIEGMVVVGVTNADGQLLLRVHREEPYAVLPHASVAAGADWSERARRAVSETAGIEARTEDVRRVKRRRYTRPDSGAVVEAYQVFLDAVPVEEPTLAPPESVTTDWRLGWYGTVPVPTTEGNAGTVADIRAFLG